MAWLLTASLILLAAMPAAAQSSDQYWQRLIASKEAQSAQMLVDLAKQLDAANAKIEELKKSCPGEGK